MSRPPPAEADGIATSRRHAAPPWLVALMVAAAGAAAVAFDFRYQLRNGGLLLFGDRYDGMIATAILEHWYNVVRGLAPWSTTEFFYPTRRTLGYNDGYFLFGLVHAAWRAGGVDTFLSAELANAVVRGVGFVAFYAMSRRVFALPVAWSLFAAVLFTLANNLFANAFHAQLFSVSFVPVLALLLHRTLTAFWQGRNAAFAGWGAGAALFYGAWLLTAFYTAWFFAFFTLILGGVLLCFVTRPFLHALRERVHAARAALALVVATALVSAAPFAWLYLPKAKETGMHSYAVARSLAPTPLDLLDVGEGNLVWGGLVGAVDTALGPDAFAKGESRAGFPPGLACAFLASVAWLALRRRRDTRRVPLLVLGIALAVVISAALTLRIGEHSVWWLVYHTIPGAAAVRAVIRYPLFLAAPVTLVVAWTLAQATARWRAAVALVMAFLLVEQVNTLPPLGLDRNAELARLRTLGPPPAECRLFYASSARPDPLYGPAVDVRYSHNVDAMIVAETYRIPTINGFASFAPPFWDLSDPGSPTYPARVEAHVARLRLPPPCALDLRHLRWRTP